MIVAFHPLRQFLPFKRHNQRRQLRRSIDAFIAYARFFRINQARSLGNSPPAVNRLLKFREYLAGGMDGKAVAGQAPTVSQAVATNQVRSLESAAGKNQGPARDL